MQAKPKKKILIVDDEAGVRDLISESLNLRNYQTFSAVNGEEGLEIAVRHCPDLILLDVMMPKVDGWQMLSNLRDHEETKGIPVVMLTARGDTDTILKSEHNRAVDFFIKPIDLEELLAFVDRYTR